MSSDIKRILIVDDNKSIHEDLRNMLLSDAAEVNAEQNALKKELFGDSSPLGSAVDESVKINYEIDDAYQGEEAVKMVKEAAAEGRPYALAFMDVRMPPGMDGIMTINEIWKDHPNTEMVICTAYSDYSWDKIHSMLGSTSRLLFVRKPFDMVAIKQVALTLTTKWELDRLNREHIDTLEEKIDERTNELKELVREKEGYISRIHEELTLAEIVQRLFLPKTLPDVKGVSINTQYIPTGKVGGDFYTIEKIDENRTAFIIFDVSGHGIAASLVTAIGRSSFLQHLQVTKDPAEVLRLVNKDVYSCTPAEMYITAFIMIYDSTNGEAIYSGAGHVPQFHYVDKSSIVEELPGRGFFLGMDNDSTYENRNTALQKGDRVLLYTDGFTESFDENDRMFGKKEVINILEKNGTMNTEELLNTFLEINNKFINGRERDDDLCLVVFGID